MTFDEAIGIIRAGGDPMNLEAVVELPIRDLVAFGVLARNAPDSTHGSLLAACLRADGLDGLGELARVLAPKAAKRDGFIAELYADCYLALADWLVVQPENCS